MRTKTLISLALAAAAVAPATAPAAPGPDPSFSGDGVVRIPELPRATAVAAAPDGGVVVATDLFRVAKLRADGTLDPAFGGGDGIAEPAAGDARFVDPSAVAIDAEGRIVVLGVHNPGTLESVVSRLRPDGTPDTTFGEGGWTPVEFDPAIGPHDIAEGLAIVDGTSILVTGSVSGTGTGASGRVRLSPSGEVLHADAWGADARWGLRRTILDGAGRFVSVGTVAGLGAIARFSLSDLSLDPSWGLTAPVNAGPATNLFHVAIGAGGEIVADGQVTRDGRHDAVVVRAGTDGRRADATTVPAPAGERQSPAGLMVHPDGVVSVAVGAAAGDGAPQQVVVASLRPDGTLDAARGGRMVVDVPDSESEYPLATAVDAQGRLLVAGATEGPSGSRAMVARVDLRLPDDRADAGQPGAGAAGGGGGGGGGGASADAGAAAADPAPAPAPAPDAGAAGGASAAPAACANRGTVRLRVRAPRGTRIVAARARVGGRAVPVRRGRRAWTVRVDVSAFSRPAVTVRVALRTRDGRTLRRAHRVATCR